MSLCKRAPVFGLGVAAAACFAVFAHACKSTEFNEALDNGNSLQAIQGLKEVPLLDVNDVSILFPKSSFISLADRFISETQFQEIIAAGEGQGPHASSIINFGADASQRKNINIVGLRYDPCAPGAHAAAQIAEQVNAPTDAICQNQLRLIAQPIVGGTDQDVTFHLLYNLPKTPADRRAQLLALAKIKEASKAAGASTDGVPLAEHPGLATGNAAVTAALDELLNLTTGSNRLVSVAVMALAGGGPEPWVFYATRNVNGKMTITPIPTIEGNGRFQALSFVTSERVIGVPSSTTTFNFPGLPALGREPILARSTHSIFEDPKFSDTNIMPLTGEMSKIHSIDNPKVNHFFTMDCVSCHTTGNLLMRRHISTQSKLEKAAISGPNSSRCNVPKGITGYVAAGHLPTQETFQRPWNVRNFGYFNGAPTVTFRTACETVEVVNDINRVVLARSDAGPNSTKSMSEPDYRRIEPAIWRCMHFDGNQTFDGCLNRLRNNTSSPTPQP